MSRHVCRACGSKRAARKMIAIGIAHNCLSIWVCSPNIRMYDSDEHHEQVRDLDASSWITEEKSLYIERIKRGVYED